MPQERTGLVTLKGTPVTLVGTPVKEGDEAPDVELLQPDLQPFRLSSLRGKLAVLCSVPSLDTSVCDREMRRFNDEARRLGEDVVIAAISVDLPFALGRWCGAAGADQVLTLSDHRETAFGLAYGVLIKEARLLARAIFVVDSRGVVRYVQLNAEVAEDPDYDAALAVTKRLL